MLPEVYNFDERVLEITDESNSSEESKNLIKQTIIECFKQNGIMSKFRKLKVILVDLNKNRLVELKEIKDNFQYALSMSKYEQVRNAAIEMFERFRRIGLQARADVNKAGIDFYADTVDVLVASKNYANSPALENEIARMIRVTLYHEAVHLLEHEISKNMQMMKIANARLENATAKLTTNLSKLNIAEKSYFGFIQITLYNFIVKLKFEGVARFVEREVGGTIICTEEEFNSLYQQALIQAELFVKNYEITINELVSREPYIMFYKKFEGFFGANEYTMGLHMTYTILFLDKEAEVISLIKMSPFQFIKKYEALIEKYGRRPIISLNSKKGIIDYSRFLVNFASIIKKLKEG